MKNKISLATLSVLTSFLSLGPTSLGSLLLLQFCRCNSRMQMSTWSPVNLSKYLFKYNAVQELCPGFLNCKIFPAQMILFAMLNFSVFYSIYKMFNKIHYVLVGLLFILSLSSSLVSMLIVAGNIFWIVHLLNQVPRTGMAHNNYANLPRRHSDKLSKCVETEPEKFYYTVCIHAEDKANKMNLRYSSIIHPLVCRNVKNLFKISQCLHITVNDMNN